MRRSELREWLGLTAADGLVYLAGAALAVMYFNRAPLIDGGLAAVALIAALAACPLGMQRNPSYSAATNAAKVLSYPFCLLMVAVLTWVNFSIWNA